MHFISWLALSTLKKEKAPAGSRCRILWNFLWHFYQLRIRASELQRMGQLVDCFEAGSDIDKVSVTRGRCLSVSLSIRTMKQSGGDWHLNIPDTQTQWTWTRLSPGRYTGDTSTAVKLIHINNSLNCVYIYLSTDAGCFPLGPWSKYLQNTPPPWLYLCILIAPAA